MTEDEVNVGPTVMVWTTGDTATQHAAGRTPAEVAKNLGVTADGCAVMVNGRPAGMDTELHANDTLFFAKEQEVTGGAR